MTIDNRPHIAVIGGGITGLAAALRLSDRAPGARVTVLEQSPRIGGKLSTGTLSWAGREIRVEQGADAILVRVPAAVELARRVGLGDDLRHPLTGSAHVWIDGALRRLPSSTVMGIPAEPADLVAAGFVDAPTLARLRAEETAPGELLTGDVSVGELCRDRLGPEVTTNVVDPLLGGVYAGSADGLSLRATVPAIAAQLENHPSLVAAARAVRAKAAPGPVFAGVTGGMSRFVEAIRAELDAAGVVIRTSTAVRELRNRPEGWTLTVGSAAEPETLAVDAVVLATPTRPAARLVAGVSSQAASPLREIDYASVAIVTLVLPEQPGRQLFPAGSGVLVPETSGLGIKAATFTGQKWGSAEPDVSVVRISVGRHGREEWLQRSDEELIGLAHADLGTVVGELPPPLAATVRRWGGALPQYAVGHLDRVARAREALAVTPTLRLAGAGYDGVGIAACVTSAQRAADELLDSLTPAASAGDI